MDTAIVPGHSPDAPGAGECGLYEHPVMDALAHEISSHFNHSVRVVQRADHGGLAGLVQHLNRGRYDSALCLHLNGAEGDSPRKGYALHFPSSDDGAKMAGILTETVEVPRSVFPAGIERVAPRPKEYLAVLRDTSIPVVLDEVAYIDDRKQRRAVLRSIPELGEQYAEAITKMRQQIGPSQSG